MNEKTETEKKYKCPKHGDDVPTVTLSCDNPQHPITDTIYCFMCFAELVKENCHVVEEI